MTFGPSTPFQGSAEQWIEASWNDIARELKVISGPAPGTQGTFLSRIGLFRQADGRNVWICLNTLVKDSRGESVILIAAGDGPFRANLPALAKMLATTSVVPVAASAPGASALAAPAPGAASANANAAGSAASASAVAGDEGVAGLYLASTAQYRLDPLGGAGSGSMEWRTEFYLLSRDGRVFRGPDLPEAPGGDINRFDYDAARGSAPSASGTWAMRGRDVVLSMGGPPGETIVATRPATGVLEIRGTNFKRTVAGSPSSP